MKNFKIEDGSIIDTKNHPTKQIKAYNKYVLQAKERSMLREGTKSWFIFVIIAIAMIAVAIYIILVLFYKQDVKPLLSLSPFLYYFMNLLKQTLFRGL
jgi:hypothetical protein